MSIEHIQDTATTALPSIGAVGIPLSQPACQLNVRTITIPKCENVDTGIWECSPGQFRRQIEAAEVMHMLAGRCTFTPDGSPSITIKAGDTLFLPPRTCGIWDIQETVRKVYVLLP